MLCLGCSISPCLSLFYALSPSWHILPPPWAMERFPFPVAILLNAWKMLRKILMRSLRAPNGNGKWNGKDDKWLWSIINFSADWAKCEPAAQEERERWRGKENKKEKGEKANRMQKICIMQWRKKCEENAENSAITMQARGAQVIQSGSQSHRLCKWNPNYSLMKLICC